MSAMGSKSMGAGELGEVDRTEAPVSKDLVTLDAMRAFLKKRDNETDDDPLIQAAISAASISIARHCERQFVEEGEATHIFEFDTSAQPFFLSLAPYEIQKIDSITFDSETDSPTTLEAEEFRAWPTTKPDGTYLGLRLSTFTVAPTPSLWGNRRTVAVTGTWGMPEIPADIANWCQVTVALWLRREVTAIETGIKLEEGYMERPKALPAVVMGALDESWTRRSYG